MWNTHQDLLLLVFSGGGRRVWSQGVREILTYLLDNHAEGRDSRSRFSFSSSFRHSLCKLAPCLASPPSLPFLSLLPSPLSSSPPPPGAAEEGQSEQMREKERVRKEGGGLRLGARGPCDPRQRTEGPSASCPAHASLKTSVAIDNSCRAMYQPQLPRHKAIGWQDLWPPPPIVGGGSMLGRVVQSVGNVDCVFKSRHPCVPGRNVPPPFPHTCFSAEMFMHQCYTGSQSE
ncbi:hypothetical protein Q5P01_017016 [Channa striata]|uniref:Uncharacterized protein n=1 Tax=Channa striata TaxID=64152 RepID=A0AA88MCC8_CHASR|nr:hypothetical protein Q5P01_017016 [Channa striata]